MCITITTLVDQNSRSILYVKFTYKTFGRTVLYTKNAHEERIDSIFYILNLT